MGVPRSYNEVADAFEVDRKTIIESLKLLLEELDLHLPLYDSSDCMSYLVEKLDLSESVENKAKQILEKAEEENLTAGRNPFGVSAAVIQIACSSIGVEILQKEVVDASTVSAVTIRSIRNRMKNKLNII